MKIIWELFITFFKIGIMTFGGGLVMIPLIEEEIVEKKGWIEREDIVNIFAVAQTVPGIIAINTATMVGFKLKGKKGALAATLGVILPSFIIILFIAKFLGAIEGYPLVDAAFDGISGAVVALIFLAAVKMIKRGARDIKTYLTIAGAFIAVFFLDINPIIIILFFGFLGLTDHLIANRKVEK